MKSQIKVKQPKPEVIDTRRHTCRSGKEYTIPITGFYDAAGVMNVEFHYGVIDDADFVEMGEWQTGYVASLGRRVA